MCQLFAAVASIPLILNVSIRKDTDKHRWHTTLHKIVFVEVRAGIDTAAARKGILNHAFQVQLMKKIPIFLVALGIVTSINATVASEATDRVTVLPHCSLKLSVHTSASKSTIWRLWSDVENWKKFDTELRYSYLVDGTKFSKGAIGYLKAKGAPKTRFELTEFEEAESFTESLKIPLFQVIELKRYFEEDNNGGTTFTHEVVFKGGLKFIMYPMMAGKFKRELVNVMDNLKDVAEREELEQGEQMQRPKSTEKTD